MIKPSLTLQEKWALLTTLQDGDISGEYIDIRNLLLHVETCCANLIKFEMDNLFPRRNVVN